MLDKIEHEGASLAQSRATLLQENREAISKLDAKINLLLDEYLEQNIPRENFVQKKKQLLQKKQSLREKSKNLQKGEGNNWLEQFRQWVETYTEAKKVGQGENLKEKRQFLQTLGSNFRLEDQILRHESKNSGLALAEKIQNLALAEEVGFEPTGDSYTATV